MHENCDFQAFFLMVVAWSHPAETLPLIIPCYSTHPSFIRIYRSLQLDDENHIFPWGKMFGTSPMPSITILGELGVPVDELKISRLVKITTFKSSLSLVIFHQKKHVTQK